MANQWFRMYHEFATDPKVQMLSETDQRRYVMLLCLKCCNDDVTLHEDEVAFQLRISNEELQATKRVLVEKGLVGEALQPTAWDKRQYKSDSSATRVARHRAKRKEAGLTSQDYVPKATRVKDFGRDASACVYCGSEDDATLDHKVPVSRGGDNSSSNLQVACRTCNADKRNMTHDEYLVWNGRVTLQKRHQNTETDTDTETEEKTSGTKTATSPPCQHQKIIDEYNSILPGEFTKVQSKLWKGTRRKALAARWKEDPGRQSVEWWIQYFQSIKACPFLMGENDRGWRPDLEWLVTAGNMTKVLEGKYVAHESKQKSIQPRSIREAQTVMNSNIARTLLDQKKAKRQKGGENNEVNIPGSTGGHRRLEHQVP